MSSSDPFLQSMAKAAGPMLFAGNGFFPAIPRLLFRKHEISRQVVSTAATNDTNDREKFLHPVRDSAGWLGTDGIYHAAQLSP
jgi:hypothetical protein